MNCPSYSVAPTSQYTLEAWKSVRTMDVVTVYDAPGVHASIVSINEEASPAEGGLRSLHPPMQTPAA